MKKLRNKKGFTLTEMLISVLLLGFVSIMVTVMTSAILSSTVTMREVAQAEILGSEALDSVMNELRLAKKVTVDDENGTVLFDRTESDTNYTFRLYDGKIRMGNDATKTGEEFGDLLFAGVSYGNCSIATLVFRQVDGSSAVNIAVEVSYGDKVLWNGNVNVLPLMAANGVADGV